MKIIGNNKIDWRTSILVFHFFHSSAIIEIFFDIHIFYLIHSAWAPFRLYGADWVYLDERRLVEKQHFLKRKIVVNIWILKSFRPFVLLSSRFHPNNA